MYGNDAKRREIRGLSNEVSVLRMRLNIANDTIQMMEKSSDRDWAMILHLLAKTRRRS